MSTPIALDIRTLAIVAAVSYGVLVAVAVLLWRAYRTETYARDLAVSGGLAMVATLLIGLRSLIPDFFSIIVGNFGFCLSLGYTYLGCCRYVDRLPRRPWHWIIPLASVPVFFWGTYIYPNLLLRIEVFSLIMAGLGLASTIRVVRPRLPDLLAGQRVTAASLATLSLAGAIRVLISPFVETEANFMRASFWSGLFLLLQIVAVTGLIASLVMMVTGRLHLRVALSEAKYRSVIEQSIDIFYRTDRTGRLTLASPSAATTLGYATVDELLGRPIEAFWQHPEQRAELLALLELGPIHDLEVTILRSDGTPLRVSVSCHFYTDKTGAPAGVEGIIRDITARRQAEAALRESEARLRTLIDAMPDLVYFKDGAGRWLEANTFSLQLFQLEGVPYRGLKDAELTRYSAFYHDAFLTGEASDEAAWQSNGFSRSEATLARPDGTAMLFDLIQVPTFGPDGARQGLVVVGRDVTVRNQIETQTRQLNGLHEQLLRPVPLSEKLKRITASVVQIFGVDYAAIWNTRPGDLCARGCPYATAPEPATCHDRTRCLHLVASAGHNPSPEMAHRRLPLGHREIGQLATGAARKLIVNDLPQRPHHAAEAQALGLTTFAGFQLLSTEAQPMGVLALFKQRPVSPNEEELLESVASLVSQVIMVGTAETALRTSEARYRSLIETQSDIVARSDLSGNLTFVNDAYCRTFGQPRSALLGRNLAPLVAPDDLPLALDTLAAIQRPPYRRHTETRHYTPTGVRWFSWENSAVRDEQGQIIELQGVGRDITDRKQVEEEIRRLNTSLTQRVEERTIELRTLNSELARAVQSRDEFLASMSHELRTPLTGILGMSEILQMQLNGPLNARQLQQVQAILDSGQHLLRLINDVLDLAKVTSGRLELDLTPVAPGGICEAALHLVEPQAQKKRLSVLYHPDPRVRALLVDERRLKQVLVNLLANAVKFTPEGGQVGLDLMGDPLRQEVQFVVWDTGIGIAPEDVPRLFQHFVQLDSRLAREYEGAGLGLALVKRMVELHSGTVRAESAGPGRGSRFTVVLPWQPDLTPPPPVTQNPDLVPAATPAAGRPRVLITDDNLSHLNLLTLALDANGYAVIQATAGEAALRLAAEWRPTVMVVDVQMPGMDGLELIRRFRAQPAFATTPILALTALAMPGDEARCLAAGATAYLSKPVRIPDLLTRLQAWTAPVYAPAPVPPSPVTPG